MINNINKFGVKQRCMEGEQKLMDLLLMALHFERDMNFYIFENEMIFLGIINRKVLLERNIRLDKDTDIRLKDICVQNEPGIVRWPKDKYLMKMLNDAFMDSPIDEAVIVSEETGQMEGIINRREFFNEALLAAPEDDEEMLCHREFSHFYKPYNNGLSRYAYNVNSQHGEDGILKDRKSVV